MEPIRVLIADSHVLRRAGVRALIEDMGGVEVVAEACDGLEGGAGRSRRSAGRCRRPNSPCRC